MIIGNKTIARTAINCNVQSSRQNVDQNILKKKHNSKS